MPSRRPASDSALSPAPPRERATHEIIRLLRQDIASGRLARSTRLPSERELARHFGVSQPTVREAVRALDAMGLVDVRHGSGVFVTGDSDQLLASSLQTLLQIERVGILEVIEVRGVLGRHSASRAAHEATDEDIERVAAFAATLEAPEQFEDPRPLAETVVAFQLAVSASAHNPLLFALESFLVRLIVQFELTAKAGKGPRFWRTWTLRFADDRHEIVEALTAHDEQRLIEAMASYLDDQREIFGSDRDIARLQLSEPTQVDAVAAIALDIPDLRPTRR